MKNEKHTPREVVVLILAGGRGERFWPRSNRQRPKQLQEVYSQKTLLAETLERARLLTEEKHIFIGCDSYFQEAILKRHPEFSKQPFIIEPEGRNTAPIIALAALELEERFPGAVHVVMPADHYIRPSKDFVKTLEKAIQVAHENFLVTLGIAPRSPDSQYGYIQAGELIKKELSARTILSFTEKPDKAKAKKYLAQGNYFWNSGIFIWLGKIILSEFQKHAPDIIIPLRASLEKSTSKTQEFKINFKKTPSLPIDIAIMEKSSRASMLRADFQWNDLGSWNSLGEVLKKDSKGNTLFTRQNKELGFAGLESVNNIIAVDEGLVALLGVRDMVLVQEGKTIFIAQRKSLDKIKSFLEQIRENPSLQKYVN